MDFNQYQIKSEATAIYPEIGHKVIYPALELCNESGEVAGKIKKIFRDKDGVFTEDDVRNIRAELGDVLWALAQIATELGIQLDDVAQVNLAKLADRKSRGVIGGNGDKR